MQSLQERKEDIKRQHERLFHKEILILRNDFYYKFYEHQTERWFFDISYRPRQVPSGDAYAIRRIDDGRVLMFLVDAMGKGASASVTSMLTASFVNYEVDNAIASGVFDLSHIVRKVQRFLHPLLFEDEVFSATFLLCDFEKGELERAMFGMPPVLLCDREGRVTKLRSNHPPLTRVRQPVVTDTTPLGENVKILCYTDGLNETVVDEEQLYQHYLPDAFCKAANYKHFLQSVISRTGGNFDDDMTFIFMEKELCRKCRVARYEIESRREAVDGMIEKVEQFLMQHGMDAKNCAYMLQAFTEVLINAYEHGNLCIDHETKRKMMETGGFDDLLKEREALYGKRKIDIFLHLKEEPQLLTFKIDVTDEGKGFDTSLMRNRIIKKSHFNGRGLLMVSKSVDAYYYNDRANRVIIKKFIPKEQNDEGA